jgi:AhpD family alkylhydroperoxidase
MTTTDYPALHRHLAGTIGELHDELSGPLQGFLQLHAAVTEDGALLKKTKELLALAISICVHCDGCIAYHTYDALSAGASHEEVLETIGVAIMMGGGPAVVYGAQAYEALGQFESQTQPAP